MRDRGCEIGCLMASARALSCRTAECAVAETRAWLRYALNNPLQAAHRDPILTATALLLAALGIYACVLLLAAAARLLAPKAVGGDATQKGGARSKERQAPAESRTPPAAPEEYALVRERPAEAQRFPPAAQGNARRRGLER